MCYLYYCVGYWLLKSNGIPLGERGGGGRKYWRVNIYKYEGSRNIATGERDGNKSEQFHFKKKLCLHGKNVKVGTFF